MTFVKSLVIVVIFFIQYEKNRKIIQNKRSKKNKNISNKIIVKEEIA